MTESQSQNGPDPLTAPEDQTPLRLDPKPRLLALWPCHSWEDFPLEMSESAAASLLACWTSMWHPALINRFQSTPGFWRADKISDIPPRSFVLAPAFSKPKIDEAGWEKIRSICDKVASGHSRMELLGELGVETGQDDVVGMVGDFFSLGFCWLQLHLMTRQIRYAGSLNEEGFQESLVAAAANFHADPESKDVPKHLQKCFDLLFEERNRFYPSDASIYRVVLARPVLNDQLLLDELAGDGPVNLLASAADLRDLSTSAPDVMKRIREKTEQAQLAIISPGQHELPTLHCHSASAIRNLKVGKEYLRDQLQADQVVFARRTTGLSPVDPEIAAKLDCRLALHSVFDADPAPNMSAPNALWQSPGGESIPVIAGNPLDAGRCASLVRFGASIGEMIDSWHYAHILVGYWPGHQSEYFRDLTRSMRYGCLMGRFRLLSKAVETLATQTWGETIDADDYDIRPALNPREPALRQAIALRIYWRQTLECQNLKKSAALLSLIDPWFQTIMSRLESTGLQIDATLAEPGSNDPDAIDQELDAIRAELSGDSESRVLFHASNHAAIATVSIPGANKTPGDLEATDKSSAIRRVHETSDESHFLIRAPAAGIVGLSSDNSSPLVASKSTRQPRMVDGHSLRNELLSIDISPTTGGIASIQRTGQRGSIASQRLAIRIPKANRSGTDEKYAAMQADSVEFGETGLISAWSLATGRLVWQDQTLANFQHRVSISREQPFVTIDVRIELLGEFQGGLWGNSVCSRLAWNDQEANRFRYLQETRTRCCREFFSSPLCTEIESDDDRISFFTGGNAWHRQSALNMMDTLLPESMNSNEAMSYRLGIGVDVANPLETAIGLLTRPLVISRLSAFPENDFRIVGWSKSTLHWYDAGLVDDADANTAGLSFRFRESAGKPGNLSIRFVQSPQRVELQDFAGKRVGTPTVVDGKIEFAYRPWQYLSLAVYWKK